MTTPLSFVNNPLTVYKFEPFSYTWTRPIDASSLQTTVSTGIPVSTVVTTSNNVVFSSSGLNVATSLAETIVINALNASGSVVSTSSNSVRIAPGRFFPPESNSIYTFFKNEAIPDISFSAPFAIATPLTTLSLPVGLSFVSNTPSNYFLSGTPLLEYPSCNYTVLGQDGPKVITTVVNIGVRPERVRLDVSGTTLKNNMTVGTAITPTTITARYPFQASSNLRYTWGELPSGIFFSDSNGLSQAPGFRPTDGSATLILQGSPNLTAASNFAALGISSNTITLAATRVSLPAISNTTNFTFSFDETVLFDTPFIQTFYVGVPVSSSATSNSYRARTYFALTDVSITNITAASLPVGVSLTFNSNDQRAYLSGTPTTAGTGSYTISAVNSNLITRDLISPITVANDVITFDPVVTAATDLCVNFILSRPVTNEKPGYYPASIQFRATAASGCNVVFSAPGLTGTGLSLSNVGSNTVQIVGIPEVIQSLSTLSVTASAIGTPATATRDISFAILNDQFTFTTSPTSAELIQNVPMTPVQIFTTTLSERNVIGYVATSIPSGLSISTTGKISGTPILGSPTSGTITWTATTGYASASGNVAYTLTPDSLLIVAPQNVYGYTAGDFVSIPIQASTYSGISVSNYVTDLSTTFGLTLGSNTGVLSGTLIQSEPPGPFLPESPQNFTIDASAGLLAGQLQGTFIANNVPFQASFIVYGEANKQSGEINRSSNYSNWNSNLSINGSPISLKSRHLGNYSNFILFIAEQPPPKGQAVYTAVGGGTFAVTEFGNAVFDDPTTGETITTTNASAMTLDISDNGPKVYGGATFSAGVLSNVGLLYESSNYGIDWSPVSVIGSTNPKRYLSPRSSGSVLDSVYTRGFTLAVKDGVFLAGGANWGYSPGGSLAPFWRTDNPLGGWTEPSIDFSPIEVSAFSLDESSNWIMTGSDNFATINAFTFISNLATATIWSSTNKGLSWTRMSNAFGLIAYSVTYGNGVWVATGIEGFPLQQNVKYFVSGGTQWEQLDLSGSTTSLLPSPLFPFSQPPPLDVGPVSFDGSNWNILARVGNSRVPTLFQHPAGTNLSNGWTAIESDELGTLSNIAGATLGGIEGITPLAYYKDFPTEPTTVNIVFSNAGVGTPPVVTSPTNTTFTFYEYVPISPIQLSATGSGDIYFFLDSADLPQGLIFDQITNTISGTPMRVGTFLVNVLVKDDDAVTGLGLTFNVLKPFVEKRQGNAGSYTSYLRQYTIVNAAQNAINTRVLPETTTLGSFMAPEPQDVTLATVDPKCFSSNNCP
jgi:hypothetical protein